MHLVFKRNQKIYLRKYASKLPFHIGMMVGVLARMHTDAVNVTCRKKDASCTKLEVP